MRNIVLVFALITFFSGQELIGQEKSDNKKIDVKIEKRITSKDGKEESFIKIILTQNGKIIAEEEGNNVSLENVLVKKGLSEDDINNISVKINSNVASNHKDIRNMMNTAKSDEIADIMFLRKKDSTRKTHKYREKKTYKSHNYNRRAMMFNDEKIAIYDFFESDKDTQAFNTKQKKEIDFIFLEINPITKGIYLAFESDKNALKISIKDANEKKIFFTKQSKFNGRYMNHIPMVNVNKGIYLLEIEVGDRNWLQKIVVE